MSDGRYRYRHANGAASYEGLDVCACCGARLHVTRCLVCGGRGLVNTHGFPGGDHPDGSPAECEVCAACRGRGRYHDCPKCGPDHGG